jgi:hypothetical protein
MDFFLPATDAKCVLPPKSSKIVSQNGSGSSSSKHRKTYRAIKRKSLNTRRYRK